MTEGAWVEGLKDLLMLPDKDLAPVELEQRGELYRKHLNCLTDRQWFHAVAEAVKHERYFPTVSALLEYGDTAPAPLQFTTPDVSCRVCDGTGFEPFERSGYSWVRFCHRGCKPGLASEHRDERTHDERRADAVKGLEQIKAALLKLGMDVGPIGKPMPEQARKRGGA